jgi:hypothetical protein
MLGAPHLRPWWGGSRLMIDWVVVERRILAVVSHLGASAGLPFWVAYRGCLRA